MYKHELYVPSTLSLMAYDAVFAMINKNYSGYSIMPAQGVWKGMKENVVIITIIDPEDNIKDIFEIIDMMKNDGEEEVLITQQEITARFV